MLLPFICVLKSLNMKNKKYITIYIWVRKNKLTLIISCYFIPYLAETDQSKHDKLV